MGSMGHNQILQVRRQPRRQERLEASLALDQKRLIERAAQIRGTSVTEFVLASAQQAAWSKRSVDLPIRLGSRP
jgi:hypothetical protein